MSLLADNILHRFMLFFLLTTQGNNRGYHKQGINTVLQKASNSENKYIVGRNTYLSFFFYFKLASYSGSVFFLPSPSPLYHHCAHSQETSVTSMSSLIKKSNVHVFLSSALSVFLL